MTIKEEIESKAVEARPFFHEETKTCFQAEWSGLTEDAKQATTKEHQLTFLEAIKTQWKAAFWSVIVSMSIVMVGYDTSLIGNFFAYPAFRQKYGNYYPGVGYQLTASWQAALPNASTIGIIIGAFGNGFFSARYGYKRVMLVALVFMAAFLFIPFFAPTVQVLLVGEIFCGLSWGVFFTVGPAYSSEVCPLALRGYLTGYVNMCMIIGQFISAGVLDGLVNVKSEWGYRIPFAVQWIWPVPLFTIILFAPESPWWLVRKRRVMEAERCVRRLTSKSEAEAKETVAMMIHTTNFEEEVESGVTYRDCFRGTNLRRTEISCIVFCGQTLAGMFLALNATYFFEQAGVSPSDAYKVGVGANGIAFIGTITGFICLAYIGRRTLYLYGMIFETGVMFLIGILSASPPSAGTKWAQVALCLVWTFVFDITIGTVAYTISSETSAMALRVKTVVVAKNAHNVVNIISSVLEPYMMNPTQWNWKGKTAFFWGGTSILVTIWTFFRLPETMGRTYEELDILFEKKIAARKFAAYAVHPFDEGSSSEVKLEGEKSSEQ